MFKRFYCFSNLSQQRTKTKLTSNFNQFTEKITKSIKIDYKFRRFFASLQQT